ncbi:MAG: nucleoside hydrolase [Anaerolineae bacterium]
MKSIIIDTDPGVDDAMAILFALKSPELTVAGLTTVYGNHYIDVTTRNALRLLELAGRPDIPVARGATGPLLRPYRDPPTFVHGEDALGDAGLAGESRLRPVTVSAAEFIVETVMAHPGAITLVPIGPLTNIALAYKLEPRIAQAVQQVVLMGGTMVAPGNVSPVAEANVHNDPEAAAIVFGAPWPVVMVGLDVTTAIVMDAAYLRDLEAAHTPYTDLIARMIPVYQKYHDEHYGMKGGMHTHDPSAIAYVLDPTLFRTVHHRVRIPVAGYADGMIIADRLAQWYDGPATEICTGVDAPRLLQLYREQITAS